MVNIFEAIKNKSYGDLIKVIKEQQDLNIKDESGNTPLVVALDNGDNSVVEMLLEAGTDVNI